MKKFFITIAMALMSLFIYAQSPQAFNYQAVAGGVALESPAPAISFPVTDATVSIEQSSGTNGSITLQASNHICFRTYEPGLWSEKMRITSNGNIGIGTTDPKGRLDVRGNMVLMTDTNFGGLKIDTDITTYDINFRSGRGNGPECVSTIF